MDLRKCFLICTSMVLAACHQEIPAAAKYKPTNVDYPSNSLLNIWPAAKDDTVKARGEIIFPKNDVSDTLIIEDIHYGLDRKLKKYVPINEAGDTIRLTKPAKKVQLPKASFI